MSLSEEPSFRLIAPFLRPVMGLLDDESVSEIMVNPSAVFVERGGRLERVGGVALDPKHVRQAALAIARSQGDDISAERPLLDARLPDGSRVMETGGFKGRSRTVPRKELYAAIDSRLGIPSDRIVNEYGMTELLSQLYEPVLTGGPRLHHPPPWVRTRVLDPATLDPLPPGREGLLCHFDLANLGSVCCVLTEDLGVEHPEAEGHGFRVLGRNPGAEPRGCSLAMDDLMTARRGPTR